MSQKMLVMEAEVEAARVQLEEALHQLSEAAQPGTQFRLLSEKAKDAAAAKVGEVKQFYAQAFSAAREGDRDAILALAATVAAAAGTVSFTVWRISQMSASAKRKRAWKDFTRSLRQVTPPDKVEFLVHSVDDPT